MMANTLEGERPLINLKFSDALKKYIVPTFFRTDSSCVKDDTFREFLRIGEIREAFGLALIVGSLLLSGSQSSEITIPLTALAGIMFYGTGKYDSRRAIKRDFELQETEREKTTQEALTSWEWSDFGEWLNGFFKIDWDWKIPGVADYYQKYHPRSFSVEFSRIERDGENSLYMRDGMQSVLANDCHYKTTQVKRLKEEDLLDKTAAQEKVWYLFADDTDYLKLDKKGEEKMIKLVKLATGAIKTNYEGELVYTFARTNDQKMQTALENAGFVKSEKTVAEWPDDLDKKAFFVLDLREKDARVKGSSRNG